VGAITQLR